MYTKELPINLESRLDYTDNWEKLLVTRNIQHTYPQTSTENQTPHY